jgi:DNA polymerase III subunit gamma/tau
MSTLYRNYRPEKFKDILGQNHLKTSLQNEVASDSLSHAYLFSGPRAVGKTTMARVLAKAVNCQTRKKGDFEPCGKCQSCLSIKESKNLEVIEIDAASNTGVDNVRDNIISFARISPSQANYKVFIIDEVHMLSISAFNALLKIIEEPPKYVIFILCTTELHKVPGTIISRCQRFDFKKIINSEIVKKLEMIVENEKVSVDNQVLLAIAKESGGHLRDAESLLGQILSIGEKTINLETAELILPRSRSMEALEFLNSLIKKEGAKSLEIINQLVEEGVDIKSFIDELIIIIRKLLLNFAQAGLAEKLGLDFGQDIELKLIDLQKNTNPEMVLKILTRIIKASQERNHLLSQLPLEIAVLELCLIKDLRHESKIDEDLSSLAKEETGLDQEEAHKKEEKAKNLRISVKNIDCQKVKELWPEFLVKIKKYNHSLSFILQNCQPGNLENGSLSLEFKYKFHHDRAQEATIRPIIEETLTEVFSSPVKIKAILNEDMEMIEKKIIKAEKTEKTEELDNIIKTFGGQIAS